MPNKYPVVTICGSMRYYEDMTVLAAQLTRSGHIVLMPFVSDYIGSQPTDAIKEMLDDMHFAKILMSERVYVVGSHIGESTSNEITFATNHGIPVEAWRARFDAIADAIADTVDQIIQGIQDHGKPPPR